MKVGQRHVKKSFVGGDGLICERQTIKRLL